MHASVTECVTLIGHQVLKVAAAKCGSRLCQLWTKSSRDAMWCGVVQGQQCSEEDLQKQADAAHRSCKMEVLLVRSVEKVLDAVNSRIRPTAWNTLLSPADGISILKVSMLILACFT